MILIIISFIIAVYLLLLWGICQLISKLCLRTSAQLKTEIALEQGDSI